MRVLCSGSVWIDAPHASLDCKLKLELVGRSLLRSGSLFTLEELMISAQCSSEHCASSIFQVSLEGGFGWPCFYGTGWVLSMLTVVHWSVV